MKLVPPQTMKPLLNYLLQLSFLAHFAFASDVAIAPQEPRFVMTVNGNVSVDDRKKVLAALETNYARISADLQTTPLLRPIRLCEGHGELGSKRERRRDGQTSPHAHIQGR